MKCIKLETAKRDQRRDFLKDSEGDIRISDEIPY